VCDIEKDILAVIHNYSKLHYKLSRFFAMRSAAAQHVISSFMSLFDIPIEQCHLIGISYPIPTFEESLIVQICTEATKALQRVEMVINLDGPLYVVGDIHGNIFDLIRIFIYAKPPPFSRFLFLGDYVDRGQYSVEVITLLFSLLIAFPGHITLLRGNHEFDSMNQNYGFHMEIMNQFGTDTLFNAFNDSFAYMPIVSIINDKIFAVHGGLSPQLNSLSQIMKIRRPLNGYEGDLISDLVWSDPSLESKTYDKSNRGLGVTFGLQTLQTFLEKFNMKEMIRAHQCVKNGISKFGSGLLYTVFSCSNYVDYTGNRCGLIFVEPGGELQLFSLPPLIQTPRDKAKLCLNIFSNETLTPTAMNSLALNLKIHELSSKSRKSQPKSSMSNIVRTIGRSASGDSADIGLPQRPKIMIPRPHTKV